MRDLAGGLEQTSTLLRSRLHTAQGMVLDFDLYTSVLRFVSMLTATDPACMLGPSTVIGSSSPCDPVQSVKLYSLAAGAFIELLGIAGLQLDASYNLRVEKLKSGRLRVTRIEEAAIGVGWGVGSDLDVTAGSLTTQSGMSAKGWVQVLLAQGTTYEIAAGDLDDFIVDDLLDHIDSRFAVVSPLMATGAVAWVTKKAVGFVDHLPLWKAHDFVSGLRKRLNWKRPAPLATFIEGGVTGGGNGSAALPILNWIPVRAKAGLSAIGRVVVGVERRDDTDTYYLDMRAEVGTPIAARLFGLDLASLRGVDAKIGVVRNRLSGAFERIELTIVTNDTKTWHRRTAVIDITDPATHPAAMRLVADLTDPSRVADALDAVEGLAGHSVTIEETTMKRIDRSSYGVHAMGTGVKFTVDELDVR
jgi:hypothetical protein